MFGVSVYISWLLGYLYDEALQILVVPFDVITSIMLFLTSNPVIRTCATSEIQIINKDIYVTMLLYWKKGVR